MTVISYQTMSFNELISCKRDLERMLKWVSVLSMKAEYENRISEIETIIKTNFRSHLRENGTVNL